MKRVAILLLLVALGLHGQEAPTITIRKGETTNVALQTLGGSEGPASTKVLQNDLDLSGWFSISPPERASYVISGSSAGGTLQGQVTDQRGSVVLQKSCSGGPRLAAHRFADDIVETLTGHKGIASSRIAFVSTRSGRKEIYTADYDGANVRQLTHDSSISVAPALAPNGSKLAYTGYQSGYADIYLIDLGSGARSRIVKFPEQIRRGLFAQWRPNCLHAEQGRQSGTLCHWCGRWRGALADQHEGVESSPTWSPDGSQIIYSSDERGSPAALSHRCGGGSGQLISTGYNYCTEPSWSPDGKRVAFTARTGGFSIGVKDLQSGATNLVASGEDPVWGADSRHIIFSSGSSLVLLDVPTGRSVPIVTGLGKVTEPTWSR